MACLRASGPTRFAGARARLQVCQQLAPLVVRQPLPVLKHVALLRSCKLLPQRVLGPTLRCRIAVCHAAADAPARKRARAQRLALCLALLPQAHHKPTQSGRPAHRLKT